MVNHLGKYTQNLAKQTKTLREFLKRNNDWDWNIEHEPAFQEIKKLMVEAPTLAHYDVNKETRVLTDASKNAKAMEASILRFQITYIYGEVEK